MFDFKISLEDVKKTFRHKNPPQYLKILWGITLVQFNTLFLNF